MKRHQWLSYFVVLGLFFVLFPFAGQASALETDDGYYIESMHVRVEVNERREYAVTETITVNFLESRHGIFRTIPASGASERYVIDEISADGFYSVEEDGRDTVLRLGAEDQEVSGRQTYVIRYVLKHFADYDATMDYIDLDLLASGWDTYIESFQGEIVFPASAQLGSTAYFSGEQGSGTLEADYFSIEESRNRITVESQRRIPAFYGLTVYASLNESVFSSAPEYNYPYRVRSIDTEIEITSEKLYYITQKMILDIPENSDPVEFRLFTGLSAGRARFFDEKASDPDNVSFSGNGTVRISEDVSGEYYLTLSYGVRPAMDSVLIFDFVDTDAGVPYDSVSATVTAPFPIDAAQLQSGRLAEINEEDSYTLSVDENTVTLQSNQPSDTGEYAQLTVEVDELLFSRPMDPRLFGSIVLSVFCMLLIVIFYFAFGRDRKISLAIQQNPPDDLSSAEVGYIINRTANTDDITSLFYYWAGKGYLKIIVEEEDAFRLEKLQELPPNAPAYEKELFRASFAKGDGHCVTGEELSERFQEDIATAKIGCSRIFRGARALRSGISVLMQVVGTGLSVLPLWCYALAACWVAYEPLYYGILAALSASGLLAVCYLLSHTYLKHRFKLSRTTRITCLVLLLVVYILIAVSIFMLMLWIGDASALPCFIASGASVAGLAICLFVDRRSDYAQECLERILGFRHYLETVSPGELEQMLAEDETYYYRTLPYAQALGMAGRWADRFRSLTLKQPEWYSNAEPFNALLLFHTMQITNRTAAAGPVHDAGGDDSFGGTDSFSGGFTGGGSGGGGGGSW